MSLLTLLRVKPAPVAPSPATLAFLMQQTSQAKTLADYQAVTLALLGYMKARNL